MLWGTTYLVTTELLPPHRPLLAALLRALPAGLLLVAITRTLPRGSWWWRSLVLGTLNIGAFNALLFVGAYRLPGGVAATVGAIQPLLVALLSTGLLRSATVAADCPHCDRRRVRGRHCWSSGPTPSSTPGVWSQPLVERSSWRSASY